MSFNLVHRCLDLLPKQARDVLECPHRIQSVDVPWEATYSLCGLHRHYTAMSFKML